MAIFPLGLELQRLWNRIITLCVNAKIIRFDDRPFTRCNALTGSKLADCFRNLKEKGIRPFPYPFGAALSIVSDIDAARRRDYIGYKSLLVDELGFDFGDSFRLHEKTSKSDISEVLAFYRYDGSGPPLSEQSRDYSESLGFYEMLREYYLGNLDHFHAFSVLGQRFVWLPDVSKKTDDCWVAEVPDEIEDSRMRSYNFIANNIPVLAIAVLPKGGRLPSGTEVNIILRDNRSQRIQYFPFFMGNDKWKPKFSSSCEEAAFFSIVEGQELANPPVLKEIKQIEIHQPHGSRQVEISALYLLNTHRMHLLNMLSHLYDNFNIHISTLTDHGSKLFINLPAEKNHSLQNAKRAYEKPLPALYSCVKKNGLYYSGLGDDPESTFYILPDLKETFGIRFINPGGSSGELGKGLNLMNVVVPSRTRDGSMVYVARRMTPPLSHSHPLVRDMGTLSFPLRLKKILEDLHEGKNKVWPIYTHLGNIKPKSKRQTPYFPKDVLCILQNRVFNIRGDVNQNQRIWFTRASILYDYSLMIRSLAPHVKRKGNDKIYIKSWHDLVLNKRLPESPNQLHGITFYVEKSKDAQVFLDNNEISCLQRNPADDTGKESVTVIGVGACHIVLNEYDFIGNPSVDEGGETTPSQSRAIISRDIEYRWQHHQRDAFHGNSYAEIVLKSTGTHSLVYYPKHLNPEGTQYFAYAVRPSSEKVKVGIMIETESEGKFYFGEKMPLSLKLELTAKYFLPKAKPGVWQLRIIPFCNLEWNDNAFPGGPLPSHTTKAVHFLISGEAGEYVSIDRVEFIRPATASGLVSEKRYVVGGQVTNPQPGMTITLSYGADDDRVVLTEPLNDALGFFAFTGVPSGSVVEIFATFEDKTIFPSRGRYFDVWGNDMNLIIENK